MADCNHIEKFSFSTIKIGLLKFSTIPSFKLDFYPQHTFINWPNLPPPHPYSKKKSSSISYISGCLGQLHPNPYPQAYNQSNLSLPFFYFTPILIFFIASAHFPSPVLISLPSSSEPLSLPSLLTLLLNHVRFFLAQSISFFSSVIASFGPPASGFCMILFTSVLLPPCTCMHTHRPHHRHMHIPDYSQHAAEQINGSSVAQPQVSRTWRGKDPFESPIKWGKVWGGITDKGICNLKLNHGDFQCTCFRMICVKRLHNFS